MEITYVEGEEIKEKDGEDGGRFTRMEQVPEGEARPSLTLRREDVEEGFRRSNVVPTTSVGVEWSEVVVRNGTMCRPV